MNATGFHAQLLGHDPARTPKEFQLTSTQKALYEAYSTKDQHGFSGTETDTPRFLGTLVLALALTEGIKPVYIIIPTRLLKWGLDQVETLGRHVMRERKHQKDAVLVMRAAFHQLRMTDILGAPTSPARWVIFGFAAQDPMLPPWIRGKLLEQEESRFAEAHEVRAFDPKPLSGVRTNLSTREGWNDV